MTVMGDALARAGVKTMTHRLKEIGEQAVKYHPKDARLAAKVFFVECKGVVYFGNAGLLSFFAPLRADSADMCILNAAKARKAALR